MRRVATTLAVLASLVGCAAIADDDSPVVGQIRFGADSSRTRVVIESDRPLDYFVFTLAEQGARVVVDLEHVDFQLGGRDLGAGQRGENGEGLVAGYRYADYSPQRSRIVLDLAAPAAVEEPFQLPPAAGSTRHRLVIDLEPTSAERFRAAAGFPEDHVPHERRRAAPSEDAIVVVLDPGHGGDQPGAIGPNGAREKTVNLALARLVRDELEATGRYRVVMTRDDDRRVELQDRVRIAREAGADLFLSIHADAEESGSSLRGASVYTLADYAEGRSRTEILAEDPWILDVDLANRRSEVEEILIDLIHRDTKNQSTLFAEALIPHLREAGPLLRNTHRSAGYYVLLAPDVPAVLLEAGFISSAEDESRLTSERHRQELAEAIAGGVNDYFNQRERLYAAR